ncbi:MULTISPECIES: sigma-54 dependent transcriptional regulator [unclassified Burkholderia]|uniref:sigma-54 interaction domain-containing protein n=1 Tax=unclassified Burkholderia TaxID=2613784 RepID=UPI00141DF24A|nr:MULTISPECIES: sigma-54 dependent transcriptional regulator [unclassified Burkholderia]NIE81965.1 sigma-54-dependent Fis family transcriptional regulator [Burkholderia sp. Tr-860]NIF61735.1 sigma-54-dependent Fis family transcriptional regulator [Burkholderia sp. Cy-647]NIF94056.1 sigma-54-dependent Fis family transcriptional regulator [Burkholderia sp. Ax-1720]
MDNPSDFPKLLALPERESRPLSIRAKAIVFADPASRAVLRFAEQLGPTLAPVLILGETGTGKELVARHIHELSGRKGAFIAVNCGAISQQLAESELFGHEAGAFTGAQGRRTGYFEEAHQGTIFLDEIGDLPLALQAKLLRVLQEGEVTRVGATRARAVDVRVVAATHVDLEQAVLAGNFRMDLFYRINLARVRLPPLRERPHDILPLAEHFRARYCRQLQRAQPMLSEGASQALLAYPWPGNIRELENVMHLALLVSSGNLIREEHLKFSEALAGQARAGQAENVLPQDEIRAGVRRLFRAPGESLLRDLEELVVGEAFEHCRYSQVRTAALLGVTRNTMRTLLARYGLLNDPRPEAAFDD